MDQDIIVGIHSIKEALVNADREEHILHITAEGLTELKKDQNPRLKAALNNIEINKVQGHELQELAKELYKEMGHTYARIPSGAMLVTNALPEQDVSWLWDAVENNEDLKILCLDQITDVHNGGAIFRTAAFYGVDIILMSSRGSFRFSPGFYRIGSGSREHLNIVRATSLPKIITRLQQKGVTCVALSEHEDKPLEITEEKRNLCLLLGSEDKGISHALMRATDHKMSLKSQGSIKSLNVSVASAVAMEKIFGA